MFKKSWKKSKGLVVALLAVIMVTSIVSSASAAVNIGTSTFSLTSSDIGGWRVQTGTTKTLNDAGLIQIVAPNVGLGKAHATVKPTYMVQLWADGKLVQEWFLYPDTGARTLSAALPVGAKKVHLKFAGNFQASPSSFTFTLFD